MFLVQQAEFTEGEGEVGTHCRGVGILTEIVAESGDGAIEAPAVGDRACKLPVARQRLLRDCKSDGEKWHHGIRLIRLQERGSEPGGREHMMRMRLNDACERAFGCFAVADGAGDNTETVMHLGVLGILRGALDEEGEFTSEKLVDIRAGGGPGREIVTKGTITQAGGNVGGEVGAGKHAKEQVAEIGERDERLRGFGRLSAGDTGVGMDHAGVSGQQCVEKRASLLEEPDGADIAALAEVGVGRINEALEPGGAAFPCGGRGSGRRVFRVGEHVGELRNTSVFSAIEAPDAGREKVGGGEIIPGCQMKVGPDERLGERVMARRPGELTVRSRCGVEVAGEGFTTGDLREALARCRPKRGVSLCRSDQVQQTIHTTLYPGAIVSRTFGVRVPHNRCHVRETLSSGPRRKRRRGELTRVVRRVVHIAVDTTSIG